MVRYIRVDVCNRHGSFIGWHFKATQCGEVEIKVAAKAIAPWSSFQPVLTCGEEVLGGKWGGLVLSIDSKEINYPDKLVKYCLGY